MDNLVLDDKTDYIYNDGDNEDAAGDGDDNLLIIAFVRSICPINKQNIQLKLQKEVTMWELLVDSI